MSFDVYEEVYLSFVGRIYLAKGVFVTSAIEVLRASKAVMEGSQVLFLAVKFHSTIPEPSK